MLHLAAPDPPAVPSIAAGGELAGGGLAAGLVVVGELTAGQAHRQGDGLGPSFLGYPCF